MWKPIPKTKTKESKRTGLVQMIPRKNLQTTAKSQKMKPLKRAESSKMTQMATKQIVKKLWTHLEWQKMRKLQQAPSLKARMKMAMQFE